AIGRHGQNVRLASQLLGWGIDVMSEDQSSEKRQKDVKERIEKFINALDIDDVIAHLLVAEGFTSIDEIALVNINELKSIEGFDEDLATELQNRAKEFLEKEKATFNKESKKIGIDENLAQFDSLTSDMILTLGNNGIKTLDDLADLAAYELVEILGEETISEKDAEKIIMSARSHWFEKE
ncbi:MAG: transcription termination/antitermination protein NusA, partial [Alphaproteobacteria bacterium]|nr:transcription termination/antitermination protein NusA [Alphaproteobacteria bacterium]